MKDLKKTIGVIVALLFLCQCSQKQTLINSVEINNENDSAASFIKKYISAIRFDSLSDIQPTIQLLKESTDRVYVSFKFEMKDSVRQNDWKVVITPSFNPSFHWAPQLTPTDEHIVAQHVFRSPAMIVTDSSKQLAIVPDLNLIQKNAVVKWYMDVNAVENKLTLGISNYKVQEHVLFKRDSGQVIPPGVFEFGFYVIAGSYDSSAQDPWRKSLAFLWEKWGRALFEKGEPLKNDIEPYIKHTYNWAFNSWKNAVWQQFSLYGKEVGAPVFIVNITQSPNYPGQVNEREFRSIWNQAWFSSMRSASGLFRYAQKKNDRELMKKALMTKELALSFPQKDGLFSSVIATPMETVEINGEKLRRSTGWKHYYFGNSNRNPNKAWGNAGDAPYHILDMSWTAYLMLCWYDELEKDKRLVDYADRYAEKLLTLQDKDGFFPAWLDTKTLQPLGVLDQSPETSMSVTFLLKLYSIKKDQRYYDAAIKAMNGVILKIIPVGQWEDFETYWSCSRVLDSLVGKKIARNNRYKQNTLSMYWTAEALLYCYKRTGYHSYLVWGQKVLDELLMYQASWQPPFIAIPALGGFGVMNADGEWNDSRQSLFAELIIQYGKELNNREYIQRGVTALKSSFVMMYCPENPATKLQWEQRYPFFNEKDYGFMMENYGHGGETNNKGLGIGEFTIYDWGNGAAAEAYNRVIDHYGDIGKLGN